MALSDTQQRISLAIKAKRRKGRLGLRAAASECGIDASTLSRLDPDELANRMEVKVIIPQDIPNFPREKAEQLLLRDPDSWSAGTLVAGRLHIVVMNPTHRQTRQRASLMEELCHISLGHKPSQ